MAATLNPQICLNMIVKDEADILERCLRSVLPVITHYSICDTGSTDATVDVITTFFERHGVPGELHYIEFGDFETARNEALRLCRAMSAPFEYILLTDADMELRVADSSWRGGLDQAAYSVRQTNGLSYYNTRVLRRDVDARYVGVTHEYLQVVGPVVRLDGIWFLDHACGSSRSEKLDRDVRLLEAGLQAEPGNTRYMFYMAQTLKDAGRFAEAANWYTRRIEAGGWQEEVWYARYMRAVCHLRLDRTADFVAGCLEAYHQRPWRAEPLHTLARHYREAGQHEACLLMCEAGERIQHPADDTLFVDNSVYRTGFLEEAGIAGYYCADPARRTKGRQACFIVATSRLATDGARATARRNTMYYARTATETFGRCELHELRLDIEAPYRVTNPTIWSHKGQASGIARAVNYILQGRSYTILDPESAVRTSNYFVTFDDEYQIVNARKMDDLTKSVPRYPVNVRGFEDCRLFRWRDRWWCSASVSDANPARHVEMAVLELDDAQDVVQAHINRQVEPERTQKNWVPLVTETEILFVYTTEPTVIVRFDPDRGFEEIRRQPCGLALDHCRGGSQAVPFREGWLYLTHEAIDGIAPTRVYLHRFIHLDHELRVAAATAPFLFLHRGVEFAAGLIHDPRRGQLVVSFGAGDARAYLAFLDSAAVASQLAPVPSLTSG